MSHSTSRTEILQEPMQQINLSKIQKEFEKKSLVICTLISICAFLFIICLSLLTSLVLSQKNCQKQTTAVHSTLVKSAKIIDINHQQSEVLKSGSSNSSDTNSNDYRLKDSTMSVNKVTSGIASKVLNLLNFRLPREIKPVHYDLFLAPDLKTNAFSGKVNIKILVEDPISFIALHANKLNVTRTDLSRVDSDGSLRKISLLQTFPYEKYEYFVIEPEKSLVAGNYEIKMEFDGRLDKRIVGFYSSTYFDERKNETRYEIKNFLKIVIIFYSKYEHY